MVWVVSRSRLKAPPGTLSPYISPLTPSGQRNCASWASQPQKSVTLPPQPGGGTTKFRRNMWWHQTKKKTYCYRIRLIERVSNPVLEAVQSVGVILPQSSEANVTVTANCSQGYRPLLQSIKQARSDFYFFCTDTQCLVAAVGDFDLYRHGDNQPDTQHVLYTSQLRFSASSVQPTSFCTQLQREVICMKNYGRDLGLAIEFIYTEIYVCMPVGSFSRFLC